MLASWEPEIESNKCSMRIVSKSIVSNTVIPRSNDKYTYYALNRHHPTIVWHLTSKDARQTNSPSKFHFGFQSSPPCLCFRYQKTLTSICFTFSPCPSPGLRSHDGCDGPTTTSYKFMPTKMPRYTFGKTKLPTHPPWVLRTYCTLVTFNPTFMPIRPYNLSACWMN